MAFLNEDNGVMTSARDNGSGQPITDVSTEAKIYDFTMHSNATTTGNGTVLTVASYKTVVVSIVGTNDNTERELVFEEADAQGNWTQLTGVRRSDLAIGTKTNSINEKWEFSVLGAKQFRVRINTITGGSISVYGVAIA